MDEIERFFFFGNCCSSMKRKPEIVLDFFNNNLEDFDGLDWILSGLAKQLTLVAYLDLSPYDFYT